MNGIEFISWTGYLLAEASADVTTWMGFLIVVFGAFTGGCGLVAKFLLPRIGAWLDAKKLACEQQAAECAENGRLARVTIEQLVEMGDHMNQVKKAMY